MSELRCALVSLKPLPTGGHLAPPCGCGDCLSCELRQMRAGIAGGGRSFHALLRQERAAYERESVDRAREAPPPC